MNSIKTTNRNGVLKISFGGLLDTKNLMIAKSKILTALKKLPRKIVIELKQYEKFDFSFIQLLLVLKSELDARELPTEFNLSFSEEDSHLLSRLNIMNLLQTKS